MARDPVVIAMSGGMDSCVVAAMLAAEHDLAFFHLRYGQRTQEREHRAVQEISRHYGVSKLLCASTDFFAKVGSSSLTSDTLEIPPGDIDREGIPSTYVPFRNGFLLAAAVSWAESLKARLVAIGAVEEDSSGYPDCRKEFITTFERAATEGTAFEGGITILTPVIGMRKSRIIREGFRLGAPLHLTWSCYRREDRPCGECDSCLLRRKAFDEAGVRDPLEKG